MAKKKGTEKGARLNAPVEGLDKKETLMHYNAVLIEELNSKMQLVIECVKASMDMERRICSKINRIAERCENHECRLAALEVNQ